MRGVAAKTAAERERRTRERAHRYATSSKAKIAKTRYDQSPQGKYNKHKKNARARGIPFTLTYKQWRTLWAKHWKKRGNRKGHYVMSRHGDTGPYAVGNVSIVLNSANVAERNRLVAQPKPPGWYHRDHQHVHGEPFTGEPGPDVPF